VVARVLAKTAAQPKLTSQRWSFLAFFILKASRKIAYLRAPCHRLPSPIVGCPRGLSPIRFSAYLRHAMQKPRRLSGPCHSDPADPAGTTTRRGRKAQVGRYRLASGHDRSARQGKLYRTHSLAQDVGLRLVEYLEQARPMNALGRAVFLRCVAPHHHLTPTRVSIDRGGCCTAGRSRRVHAHRLRHTAATNFTYRCVTTGIGQLCVTFVPRQQRSMRRSTVTACA
jgi:hypothetical protein